MTIAKRLKEHLDAEAVAYETVPHPQTATSSETAEAAHVPGDRLAKSVVLHDEKDLLVAVVPSTHRVDLSALHELLDRELGLASEAEVGELFEDCDRGAAPPVGAAYGVPVVLDQSLLGQERVWFEGGDHRTVVQVSGSDFDRLMRTARLGSFGRRA